MLHNYTWQYTIRHFDKNLVNETNYIFTIYYISSPKCYTPIVTTLLHLLKHMHWELIHILTKMQICAVARNCSSKTFFDGETCCNETSWFYILYCIFASKETGAFEAKYMIFQRQRSCFLIYILYCIYITQHRVTSQALPSDLKSRRQTSW